MPEDLSVRNTFDRLASDYDDLKLRIIPAYRQIQRMTLRYAAVSGGERVLELGCGTGEWASLFLKRYSDIEYLAIEFSEKMRELASQRCAKRGGRIELLNQDLNQPLPPGPFDLVVSFFAIHHVRDKRRLIGDVYDRLSPSGRFIYADITVAADPALERMFLDGWVAFMRDAGLEEDRIGHILADHRENDLPESAEQQLAYMRAAGFVIADLAWSCEKFAMFYGEKRAA